MKKNYIIIIAILLLTGLLAANERDLEKCDEGRQGMQGRFEGKQDDGMHMMKMAKELELTEAQFETLEEIHLEHKKFMIQTKADIEILQLDKKTAMEDKNFSEAKRITEKIFEKKQLVALKKIDFQEEIWNSLTDEQKLKAKELKLEKMHPPKKMHDGMGMKHHM